MEFMDRFGITRAIIKRDELFLLYLGRWIIHRLEPGVAKVVHEVGRALILLAYKLHDHRTEP